MRPSRLLSALLTLLLIALASVGVPASAAQIEHWVPIEVFSESGLIETFQLPEKVFQEAPGSLPWAAPPSFEVVKLLDNGPDSENIVLTIMGDGFTAAQQDAFIAAAVRLSGDLLTRHPFGSFQDAFNVYAIKVISRQSGAAENPGETVDNYFGSKFYFDGVTERLLSITYLNRATELLNYYTPLYDMAAVLVNSTKYGGAGGSISVTSCHADANEILMHELGHTVGDLADEYWWRGREAPNMTQNANPSTVKWRPWLNVDGVGIYAFAQNEDPSWYRPHQSCAMRYLYQPFCGVCATELTRVMSDMSKEAFYGRGTFTSALIPNGITRIGDYAYYGCENLSTVSIPASLARIGRYAFLRCAGLARVFNYAVPPQVIDAGNVFYGVDRSNITLTVPEGAGAAYLAAGWTGFREVIEISRPVTGITLDDETAIALEKGAQLRLNAAVVPADADNLYVRWTSGNPAVATVDESGLVTAAGKGATTITAITAEGGKTAACGVTVTDSTKYVGLFGLETKYPSNFWNWFKFIVLFGWIWMWF